MKDTTPRGDGEEWQREGEEAASLIPNLSNNSPFPPSSCPMRVPFVPPSQREQLEELCSEEERRHQTTIQRIETHTQDMKVHNYMYCKYLQLHCTLHDCMSCISSVFLTIGVRTGNGLYLFIGE